MVRGLKAVLLNAAMFQIGWFLCILGGNAIALVYTLVAILVHAKYLLFCSREWYLLIAITLLGFCWDSALQAFGLISFSGGGVFIPVWLACLWLLFATSILHSFAWLQHRLLLASILGAVAGPLSYFAGGKLGAAIFYEPSSLPLLVIAGGWAVILPLCLYFSRYCHKPVAL